MGKIWQKWKALSEKVGKTYPPGYDYRAEQNGIGAFLGLGMGMNLSFFVTLHSAYEGLFMWFRDVERGETQPQYRLIPGVSVEPFLDLVQGYFWWYLPWVLALVVTIVLHYLYYYQGAKSIYVMWRLKNPFIVAKSCVMGVFVQLALGLMVMFGIFFIYYGIYYAVIPDVCNPRFM